MIRAGEGATEEPAQDLIPSSCSPSASIGIRSPRRIVGWLPWVREIRSRVSNGRSCS